MIPVRMVYEGDMEIIEGDDAGYGNPFKEGTSMIMQVSWVLKLLSYVLPQINAYDKYGHFTIKFDEWDVAGGLFWDFLMNFWAKGLDAALSVFFLAVPWYAVLWFFTDGTVEDKMCNKRLGGDDRQCTSEGPSACCASEEVWNIPMTCADGFVPVATGEFCRYTCFPLCCGFEALTA